MGRTGSMPARANHPPAGRPPVPPGMLQQWLTFDLRIVAATQGVSPACNADRVLLPAITVRQKQDSTLLLHAKRY